LVSFKISEFCSGYGKGSKVLFHLFMWYERLVNSSAVFEGLRHTIDCVVRKPLPGRTSGANNQQTSSAAHRSELSI